MADMNAEDLARRLNAKVGLSLTPQAIRNYLNGESVPKSDVLYNLANFFGKPMGWFFGEEFKVTKVVHPPALKIQEVPRFKKFAESFSKDSYIPIRLMRDPVAGGHPLEVSEQDSEGWVLIYASKNWIPNDPEYYTCAHVQGRSMWPILGDGDIVAIDHMEKDPKRLDKSMVAFRVDGGVTIKWLKFFPEKSLVVGVPENKDEFDTVISLRGEEIDNGIVGRIAWWWAKRSPGHLV